MKKNSCENEQVVGNCTNYAWSTALEYIHESISIVWFCCERRSPHRPLEVAHSTWLTLHVNWVAKKKKETFSTQEMPKSQSSIGFYGPETCKKSPHRRLAGGWHFRHHFDCIQFHTECPRIAYIFTRLKIKSDFKKKLSCAQLQEIKRNSTVYLGWRQQIPFSHFPIILR